MTLFNQAEKKEYDSNAPLADRMRPKNLDEFVGQKHLVGNNKILRRIIEEDKIYSIIFWGPPGSGKTTLAKIIANSPSYEFIQFSAVTSGIKQIRDVMQAAQSQAGEGKKTILFIDEIHRFNKAQQDAFLPFVEKGIIILIGATTENPSFEVNSALLSRCKVYILEKLKPEEIKVLLKRSLKDKKRGLGKYDINIGNDTIDFISNFSDGDSRVAYNILELAFNSISKKEGQKINIGISLIENVIQKKALLYDKQGEEHFNLISALHKSLRGSDPDAAVYWTVRMLESGEDPLYILRRMTVCASEDIGLADPEALKLVIAAKDSFEFLGPPEGYQAIIEAALYLALAPKSNSVYMSLNNAKKDVHEYTNQPVPYHIRNAPTKLMKDSGYGKGYKYPHNFKNAIVRQHYLPEKLIGRKYYNPNQRGFEKTLKNRLDAIKKLKEEDLND